MADALPAVSTKEGTALLAEICRALSEAVEHVDASEGQGASNVPSPIPHEMLTATDEVEGNALHFAASRALPSAALALLRCEDFTGVAQKRYRDGSTALHLAASTGLDAVVQALLQRKEAPEMIAALDKDGFNALHAAAFQGHLSVIRLLLSWASEAGCAAELANASGTFDVPRPVGNWAYAAAELCDMNTALHMAAAAGHAKILTELLAAGPVNVDQANRIGSTALHMAAKGGHVAACSAILASPLFQAVNARDLKGATALHYAARQANGHICAALVQREDFTAFECKDLRGQTAANIAEELSHYEVQRLILSRTKML